MSLVRMKAFSLAKQGFDLSLGDDIATAQSEAAPFTPLIPAAANAVRHTDIGKAVAEGIEHFSDGMPILMHALDEVKALHPFIGGMCALPRESSCV